jgi:hypothetical protein
MQKPKKKSGTKERHLQSQSQSVFPRAFFLEREKK